MGWGAQIPRKGHIVHTFHRARGPVRVPPGDELIHIRFLKFVLCVRGQIWSHSGLGQEEVYHEQMILKARRPSNCTKGWIRNQPNGVCDEDI